MVLLLALVLLVRVAVAMAPPAEGAVPPASPAAGAASPSPPRPPSGVPSPLSAAPSAAPTPSPLPTPTPASTPTPTVTLTPTPTPTGTLTPTPTATLTPTPPSSTSTARVTTQTAATARDLRVAQAILDAAAVVKELVENALDGGATRVDVRVRGAGGLAAISVADNGRGIPAADQAALCVPHATSKWAPDTAGGGGGGDGDPEHRIAAGLGAVATYGFRGEALSAIAALCETLVVTTRTAGEEVGRRLTYGPDGSLAAPPALAPRHPGTTVEAGGLFARLPVRRTDAARHAKRETGRLLLTVQAFAVIATAARVVLYVDGQAAPVISTKPRPTPPPPPPP